MEGLKNFCLLISDNWILILVCIGLTISIYEMIHKYLKRSKDEKMFIAKKIIGTTILAAVSSAEKDFEEWNKAGEVKRSQVIAKIYEEWPILKKVSNQDEIEEWLDKQIKGALNKIKNVANNNLK